MLLVAATGAFGGLAVLPAPADAGPPASRSATSDEARLPLHALSLTSSAATARERARNEAATSAAVALRVRERASRDRTRPPAPAAAPEAAAAPKAAVAPAAPKAPAPAAVPAAPAPEPAAAAPAPKPAPPKAVRPGVGRLTSQFGPRWGRLHAGIDLAAGVGAPIVAVAAGTVVSAGDEGGYGRCVRVQHPDGTVSLYAHLSELLVAAGKPVAAGTPLGREGSTGNSTGPHLHFEIRVGDRPIDPLPWLRARGIDPAAR